MSSTCQTFSYKSVDGVCDTLFLGSFMATVDIGSAYRSLSIHPDNWTYQGVRLILDVRKPSYLMCDYALDPAILLPSSLKLATSSRGVCLGEAFMA